MTIKITLSDIIRNRRGWGPIEQSWFGKPAPDFTVTDIDGKSHKLSDYRGKDVIVVLWATWCRPCMMEIPHLIALQNTLGKEKLAILGISFINNRTGETPEKIKAFASQNPRINYALISANLAEIPRIVCGVLAFPMIPFMIRMITLHFIKRNKY